MLIFFRYLCVKNAGYRVFQFTVSRARVVSGGGRREYIPVGLTTATLAVDTPASPHPALLLWVWALASSALVRATGRCQGMAPPWRKPRLLAWPFAIAQ